MELEKEYLEYLKTDNVYWSMDWVKEINDRLSFMFY